jgi:hypothetical protein
MADAIRPGGVYYVGGRLENGKPTGGRWLDANGNETDAPTRKETAEQREDAATAEQAHQEAVAAQRAAVAQPVAVVEAPTRRGR